MTHTPGPWNMNGTCLVAKPNHEYPEGYAVAKVFNADDVPLIAAAPDMLKALQLIYANAGESPEWIRSRIESVIARATGSSL